MAHMYCRFSSFYGSINYEQQDPVLLLILFYQEAFFSFTSLLASTTFTT